MRLLDWFRQKQAKQTKKESSTVEQEESSTIEQKETKLVERETFIQDGYFAEVEVHTPPSGIDRPGFWFYTLYQYSEETGKGKLIVTSDVRDGDKELALFIACFHIDLLCKQGSVGNNQN